MRKVLNKAKVEGDLLDLKLLIDDLKTSPNYDEVLLLDANYQDLIATYNNRQKDPNDGFALLIKVSTLTNEAIDICRELRAV